MFHCLFWEQYLHYLDFFFKGFEPTIQSLGFIGFLLICCLVFSITILLELTGMMKIIDDLGKQYIVKNNKADKSIYNFYKSYKDYLKTNSSKPFVVLEDNNKNTKKLRPKKKEIDGYTEEFVNYSIGVNQRSVDFKLEICYQDTVLDVIQEVSNIAISYSCKTISAIYDNIRVNTKLPETIICKNIYDFNDLINTKGKINIVVSFGGLISGCILISFDKKAIIKAQRMFESKYKNRYITLQTMLISYFKEMAAILAGRCITCISAILAGTCIIEDDELLVRNALNGTKMENIHIKEITTFINNLYDFFDSESIISVSNTCRVYKLTSVQIYLLFNVHQAKVIADKLTK